MIDDSLDLTIGTNIKRLREAHGYSQAQLAEHVGDGWRQQTVLKIEKGTRPLRAAELAAVAEFLSVGVDELLRAEDVAARQLAQVAGMFHTVRTLYDVTVRQIVELEEWRLDLASMYAAADTSGMTPKLREAVEHYSQGDVVELAVTDARNSGRVRIKREAVENG